MNSLLKSRKGVVLVWVLVLYMFFISWFHVCLNRIQDYQEENKLVELLDNLKSDKRKNLVLQYFQLHDQQKNAISIKQLI